MAYQTYTTDALVLGSTDHLTADRYIALFTRDAGLVHARAISVRREQSKLRYGLQDFSLARVSLVRGKSGWRITGAERASNLYFQTDERNARGALLRVLRLVRRLVRGEETHIALYDTLIDGLATLAVCDGLALRRGERVLTLRLLSVLGYIAPKDAYEHALAAPSLADALALAHETLAETDAISAAVVTALATSQL